MNGMKYGEPDFKYIWAKIKKGGIDPAELKAQIDAAVERAIEEHGTGTTDYNQLSNKPSIKNTVLQGNKSFEQLGLYEDEDDPDAVDLQRVSNTEIQAIVTFTPSI